MVLTRGVVSGWAVLLVTLGGSISASAQAPLPGIEVQPRVERPTPGVELDVAALVHSPDVLPGGSIDDPVWTVEPQPGRRLVQVPMRVEPLDEPAELADPSIDLRGARFIGWRIDPDDRTTPEDPAARRNMMAPSVPTADRRRLGDLLPFNDSADGSDFGGRPPMGPPDPRRGFANAAGLLDDGLPPGAPRLTRELIVHPDGTLAWTLDRVIPGATVKEGREGYALKLRPDLLAAMEPQRPQANAGGGDPAEVRRQRREEQMRFRQEIQAFRQLREAVRNLPEQFETPLPDRIWAVYEAPANLSQFTFHGEPPLPWSVRDSDLQTLRALGGGGRGAGGEAYAAAASLEVMAREGHPLTHRAIAYALQNANLIGQAQINDTLYQLLRRVVTGPDSTARRIIVEGLASSPSAASAALLRDAAQHMTPEMQLLALRGLLQGDAINPQQFRDMIDNANQAMADPNGPEAGLVLQAIAEGVSDLAGQAGPTFITGIQFDTLPDERLDQAIAYVVRAAGERPLAAAWLNHRLLGSHNQATVRRTLELLSRASGGAGVIRPLAQALTGAVFGAPAEQNAAAALDLTVTQPIPIDTISHSIFRGINSGDAEIRELAWRALPNFTVTPDPSRRGSLQPGPTDDIVAQVLVAGLSQQPTPPQLVRFLARQRESQRATTGLVEVVLYADTAAAKAAARALLGSARRDLPEAVASLPPEQRAEFAGQVYHALTGRAPLVAGLFAAPEAEGPTQRFATALAEGELLEPAGIAEAFGEEMQLLNLAASNEPRVAAGAVAALVARVGGDDLAAQELAQRFQNASDRSPAALASAWSNAKRDIFTRSLADAAGPYRVQVRLFDGGLGAPPPGMPPEYYDEYGGFGGPAGAAPTGRTPREIIPIGVVDLNVDGQAVYLGNQTVNLNVAEERLALRLNAGDLRNFQNEQVNQIPFDRLVEPITLLPQQDGSWRGSGMLPDGTSVEVVLEPVEP